MLIISYEASEEEKSSATTLKRTSLNTWMFLQPWVDGWFLWFGMCVTGVPAWDICDSIRSNVSPLWIKSVS